MEITIALLVIVFYGIPVLGCACINHVRYRERWARGEYLLEDPTDVLQEVILFIQSLIPVYNIYILCRETKDLLEEK